MVGWGCRSGRPHSTSRNSCSAWVSSFLLCSLSAPFDDFSHCCSSQTHTTVSGPAGRVTGWWAGAADRVALTVRAGIRAVPGFLHFCCVLCLHRSMTSLTVVHRRHTPRCRGRLGGLRDGGLGLQIGSPSQYEPEFVQCLGFFIFVVFSVCTVR